jgi:hypothetical protein
LDATVIAVRSGVVGALMRPEVDVARNTLLLEQHELVRCGIRVTGLVRELSACRWQA